MEKNKTYFIALDTDSYNLKEGIIPINLNWDCTMYTWLLTVKEALKDAKDDDIIVGHSVGATMALFGANKGLLKLYSPSPIFKEVKNLLSDELIKQLGDKYNEIDNFSIKGITLKPICYLGNQEDEIMKKTFKEIKKHLDIESHIVEANHANIIREYEKIN